MGLKLAFFSLALLALTYQNCGPANDASPDMSRSTETVFGLAAEYKKFVYDPQLEAGVTSPSRVSAEVNTGDISIGVKSCVLDASRLAQLRSIFQSAKICQPIAPPNAPICLALGIADIELSNDTQKLQLRPVICHSGIYLCDGLDAEFRNLISDILQNRPAGCR